MNNTNTNNESHTDNQQALMAPTVNGPLSALNKRALRDNRTEYIRALIEQEKFKQKSDELRWRPPRKWTNKPKKRLVNGVWQHRVDTTYKRKDITNGKRNQEGSSSRRTPIFTRMNGDNNNRRIANVSRLHRAIDKACSDYKLQRGFDLHTKGAIYVIYHKKPHDRRLYVGQTSQTIANRFQEHYNDGRKQMRERGTCDSYIDEWLQGVKLMNVSVMCAEVVPRRQDEPKKQWEKRLISRELWWIKRLHTFAPKGHNYKDVQHLTAQYRRNQNRHWPRAGHRARRPNDDQAPLQYSHHINGSRNERVRQMHDQLHRKRRREIDTRSVQEKQHDRRMERRQFQRRHQRLQNEAPYPQPPRARPLTANSPNTPQRKRPRRAPPPRTPPPPPPQQAVTPPTMRPPPPPAPPPRPTKQHDGPVPPHRPRRPMRWPAG